MRRALALVLLLAGCGTTGLHALPSQGGPAWRELESEHFTLWTNADLPRALAAWEMDDELVEELKKPLPPDYPDLDYLLDE